MLTAGSILMIGMGVIQTLTRPILSLFNASPELLSIGSTALRIISLSCLFVVLTLIIQGVYQARGNGIYSLIITIMRVELYCFLFRIFF
ncbi:hypothetical protein Holit_00402 [Hollandina sp. SP2]